MRRPDGVAFFEECVESFKRFRCMEGGECEARVKFLRWIRMRLMKARCYRKLLSVVERSLIDVTIKLAERGLVKLVSRRLLNTLGCLLMKIGSFAKRFTDLLADFGEPILLDVCRVAASWGNPNAVKWLLDKGFAAYLALLKRSLPEFNAGVC
ncbi:MAG: hypothetical protein QW282_06380 [Nitrososphaerales archaeon]